MSEKAVIPYPEEWDGIFHGNLKGKWFSPTEYLRDACTDMIEITVCKGEGCDNTCHLMTASEDEGAIVNCPFHSDRKVQIVAYGVFDTNILI